MRRSVLLALAVIAAACTTTNTVVAPVDPLLAPVNLTYELVPSGDPTQPVGILLRWDPPADTRVTTYNVYSRGSTSGGWYLRATTTSASFYDLGTPDLQYAVTSADAGYAESAYSNLVTVNAANQLPAPAGLVPVSLNTAIQLSWSANARLAAPTLFSYYRVYSTPYTLGTGTCTAAWVLEGTTVSEDFIASGLPNGSPRCFAVSAVSTDGHESDWSTPTYDTPRFDARNIVVTAFQVTPATSGFSFYDPPTQTIGLVTSGARTDIDFRLDRHGDGSLWLLPIISGTSVASLGPIADLTSIDIAPAGGYGTAAVPAVIGSGYVFQLVLSDGFHYGGVRVTALGTNYAIIDWSYQSDPGNPELSRVKP